jgi:hypothetical protein
MIPAFVWEYKLILRFIIRVSSHLKEALCVFGGSTIQEVTVSEFANVNFCNVNKSIHLFFNQQDL